MSARTLRSLSVFTLVAVGCAVEPVDSQEAPLVVEARESTLLGKAQIDDCTPAQSDTIVRALRVGKLIAATPEFQECVLSQPYRACDGSLLKSIRSGFRCSLGDRNRTVDGILDATQTGNDLVIGCDDLGDAAGTTGALDVHRHLHDGREAFELDRAFLDSVSRGERSLPTLAATIWHEALHTHGFMHGSNGLDEAEAADCCALDPSYRRSRNSANHIVGRCMRNFVGTNVGAPNAVWGLLVDRAQQWLGRAPSPAEWTKIQTAVANEPSTPDYIDQDLLGFRRAFVADLPVWSGADVLRDAAITAGELDGVVGTDVALAAIDHNSGLDYWRLRLGSACNGNNCVWGRTFTFGSGGAELASTGIATVPTPSGDALVLSAIDRNSGLDYLRLRFVRCPIGNCVEGPLLTIGLGGDDLHGGGIAAGNLDDDPRPEIFVAAIDRNSGPDYWRFVVLSNCDANGCQRISSAMIVEAGGAADLVGGGVAIADLDGDGRNEVFLAGLDPTGAFRYRIGTCAGAACAWSPTQSVTTRGGAMGYGNVAVGRLGAAEAGRTKAVDVLLTGVDLWSTGRDYYRSRAGRGCNVKTGRCFWGAERLFLSDADVLQGGGAVVVNLPGAPGPTVIYASADVNSGGDYWRWNAVVAPDLATSQRYWWSIYGEPNDRIEEAIPIADVDGTPYRRAVADDDAYAGIWVDPKTGAPLPAGQEWSTVTLGKWSIGRRGDVDHFALTPRVATDYTISIELDPARGDLDLALLDEGGRTIATSAGVGATESITATLQPGTHYVQVRGYRGATGTYSLKVRSTRNVPVIIFPDRGPLEGLGGGLGGPVVVR